MVPSPELSTSLESSDSQDTIILSESPSGKRQRLDTEAKNVRINTQTTEQNRDYIKAAKAKKKITTCFYDIFENSYYVFSTCGIVLLFV